MNLKRISAIAMLAALPLGGLTACGGEDAPAPAPTSSATTTTATSTETPSTSTTSETPDLPTDGPSIYTDSEAPAVGEILVSKGEGGFWFADGYGASYRTAYRAFDNGRVLFGDNTGVYIYDPASRQITTVKMPNGIVPTGRTVVMQGTSALAIVSEKNAGESLDGDTYKISTIVINQDGTATRGAVLATDAPEAESAPIVFDYSKTTKWFTLKTGDLSSDKYFISDGTKLQEVSGEAAWVGPYYRMLAKDSMSTYVLTDPTGALKPRTYFNYRMGLLGSDKYYVFGEGNLEFSIYDLATGKKLSTVKSESFLLGGGSVVVGNVAVSIGGTSNEATVSALDITTGKVLYSKSQSDQLQLLGAADATHVWIANFYEKKLYKVEASTGNIVSTAENQIFDSPNQFNGMGFAGKPTTVVQALGQATGFDGDGFQSLINLVQQ